MAVLERPVTVTGHEPRQLAAEPPPGATIVDAGDTVVHADTGATLLVVAAVDEADTALLRRLLRARRMKWEGLSSEPRMSGLRHLNNTFGFRPRSPLRRREACGSTALPVNYPELGAEIDRITPALTDAFKQAAPDAYDRHCEIVAPVLPEWRIAGSPWTSGVVNNTAALTYHRDANNFPHAWSAMLVARHNVRGGLLHVPEVDVHVACSDSTLVLFPGCDFIHAVTPFHKRTVDAYRFTLVWYAVRNMARCLPCAEEERHAWLARTARETASQ